MLDRRHMYLVAVGRTGSFSAAAQGVGVTQSAVTKGVADLERHLGYSLFHRTGRGALLTEKGRDYFERAARLLDDARELQEGSSVKGDPYAGVLRVGVCPASLEWRLIDPIATLLTRHPSIRVEVTGASFERMVQQLRNGAVDVAVGFDAAFSEWPDLHREPLAAALDPTVFVRKNHPILQQEGKPSMADLARYDFIAPSESRPYGALIRAIYESQNIEWRKHLHVIDYFPIVRRVVACSDAIGIISLTHAAASANFQRQFTILDHLNVFPPMPLCCAVRARWEPRPAVRALISAVRAS